MSDSRSIVPYGSTSRVPVAAQHPAIPEIVFSAGNAARFAWEEFFEASIANHHTRKNYIHAVSRFLSWAEGQGLELRDIEPGHVGRYFQQLKAVPVRSKRSSVAPPPKALAPPTKKVHQAALRGFFDCLVNRHVIAINPTATVRGERYSVIEGRTPHILPEQARRLLTSIDTTNVVGLRDQAVLAVLLYTAARVGAVSRLEVQSLKHDGTQYTLRFAEKGGKSREIPVRHDLEQLLLRYIRAAEISVGPLFRTTTRRTQELTGNPMTGIDIARMMKRRLKEAGLPLQFSPHSFRVTTITDLLEQDISIEDVQFLAGHNDIRTTRLYDRRARKVTRNLVERISINIDDPCA